MGGAELKWEVTVELVTKLGEVWRWKALGMPGKGEARTEQQGPGEVSPEATSSPSAASTSWTFLKTPTGFPSSHLADKLPLCLLCT